MLRQISLNLAFPKKHPREESPRTLPPLNPTRVLARLASLATRSGRPLRKKTAPHEESPESLASSALEAIPHEPHELHEDFRLLRRRTTTTPTRMTKSDRLLSSPAICAREIDRDLDQLGRVLGRDLVERLHRPAHGAARPPRPAGIAFGKAAVAAAGIGKRIGRIRRSAHVALLWEGQLCPSP